MYRHPLLHSLLAACLIAMAGATSAAPHSPGAPYAARGLADRIVLTPGADPAREMAVAYRTDSRQRGAEVQLAPALDGPDLQSRARLLHGGSQGLTTENGKAMFHQVRFSALQPDSAYVYRVKGADGWSEWLQFRTAKVEAAPFRFLYLGDVQNGILALASRTIRQAFQATASPALVVHAGDLVAQRDELIHDDEWGEWNQAGGFHYAQLPQLPAAGNHEYIDVPDGTSIALGPHWPLQFDLPDNGAAGAERTSYHVDYQGVRFIVLDGTSALELGTLASQTRWLRQTLRDSRARWNIVVTHQPLFTCARPEDSEPLKTAWQPIFEHYRVDLVLQGHDHCYSRLSHEDGQAAGRAARQAGTAQGPVYLVSVAGSKMYGLNDRASQQPDRVAEDTQLYQVIDVTNERLAVRSHTASGRLYDAFDLRRAADGRNRLEDPALPLIDNRTCSGPSGPDGLPCTARGK